MSYKVIDLNVWSWPIPTEDYIIGVIPGDQRDPNCPHTIEIFQCWHDPEKRGVQFRQVAEWQRSCFMDDLAFELNCIGRFYNDALIAVECNSDGILTNSILLRTLRYPNVYRWRQLDRVRGVSTDYFGWWTNCKTGPLAEHYFCERLTAGAVELKANRFVGKLLMFDDVRVRAAMMAAYCASDTYRQQEETKVA